MVERLKRIRRKRYFDGKLQRGFMALFTGRVVSRTAASLLGIFLPIFLYEMFEFSFYPVALFFMAASLLYVIFLPFGGMALTKWGLHKALQVSTFIGALFYGMFYFATPENIEVFLTVAVFAFALYRIFFWVPYRVDFAKLSNKRNRGRQVGALMAVVSFIGIFTPVLAGWVITAFSYDALFFVVVILYLAAFIPYRTLPKITEQFSWSYRTTWRKLFSNRHAKVRLAFFADGMETGVGLVVWPIFMYNILDGDILKVGFISTVIVAITVILQLTIGSAADKRIKKESILKYGSGLYAVGWILKIFIATAFHIFIFDAYHKLTRIFSRMSFDAMFYDTAADQGRYVDEFTVLREMALHLGRVLIFTIAIVLSFFIAIKWVFIIAAGAALVLNMARVQQR